MADRLQGAYSPSWPVQRPRRCRAVRPSVVSRIPAMMSAERAARGAPLHRWATSSPGDVRTERRWQADGVDGEELSWSVGFGPRTASLRPQARGARGRRCRNCRAPRPRPLQVLRQGEDRRRAGRRRRRASPVSATSITAAALTPTNSLAKGFVVLVHDIFLWGIRRFPLEVMPERERALADTVGATLGPGNGGSGRSSHYNGAAYMHEHLVSKYCTLLGTSIAAVVAYEDRVALELSSLARRCRLRPRWVHRAIGRRPQRSALLRATSDDFAACVIAGMMNTYEGLLDDCVAPHTWMLFPAGWSVEGRLARPRLERRTVSASCPVSAGR